MSIPIGHVVTGLEGEAALQCPELAKVTCIIGTAILFNHAKSHYRRNRILHRCVSAFPFASHLPIFLVFYHITIGGKLDFQIEPSPPLGQPCLPSQVIVESKRILAEMPVEFAISIPVPDALTNKLCRGCDVWGGNFTLSEKADFAHHQGSSQTSFQWRSCKLIRYA